MPKSSVASSAVASADRAVAAAYVDVPGAATYLQVKERTIREWVWRGVIPTYRVPGTRLIRFRTADLDRFMEQGGNTGGVA